MKKDRESWLSEIDPGKSELICEDSLSFQSIGRLHYFSNYFSGQFVQDCPYCIVYCNPGGSALAEQLWPSFLSGVEGREWRLQKKLSTLAFK